MYIDGIGISGYRSFGRELQEIGPFTKINLLIGQNNSGKSNILTFLTQHYKKVLDAIRSHARWNFDLLDRHIGQEYSGVSFSLCLPIGGDRYNSIINDCPDQRLQSLAERVLKSNSLSRGGNAAWFKYHAASPIDPLALDPELVNEINTENVLTRHEWHDLWAVLTKQRSSSLQNRASELLDYIARQLTEAPEVNLIPAIRRIGDSGSPANDYSGIGIIDRLAQLQNPKHNEQHHKRHFQEINDFLKKVVGNSSAQLEIPYERDMVLVHMDNRTLPLSSLGTGIHEVIILAAAATVLRQQVLCIEEPELHLHPLLQRKLIRYLRDKTDNQYFFTTHSAHLLDTPGAAIFHVRHQEGASTVEPVYTASAKSLVCVDLGYRASDLLQANCVIWVEGPSDRIYLNHWIRSLDPKLIEGIHYSIMFYGGRLLSHLSALDPEVTEFISLRRLNRYISIVIDSDRTKQGGRINETKRRVKEEFDSGPGFAWITKGREIENYIPPAILEEAVKKVHKKAIKLNSVGQYDNALHYRTDRGVETENIDKVKIAHEVVSRPADLSILDLKPMVEKLVRFIRDSNESDEYL